MNDNYDDIINLPHPVSRNHRPMPMISRAAQFSPFAALTGHDDAIQESARLTFSRLELEESSRNILNDRLNFLLSHFDEFPEVEIAHFVADSKKSGGKYIITRGFIKKYDEFNRTLIMSDGTHILIPSIIDISGDVENKLSNDAHYNDI